MRIGDAERPVAGIPRRGVFFGKGREGREREEGVFVRRFTQIGADGRSRKLKR